MIQNSWILLSILTGFASFSLWAEKNTKWGKAMGCTNIALVAGLILVNLKIVPTWSDVYGVVFSYMVPIAIALLLFSANLRSILVIAKKLVPVFLLGSIATMIAATIAALIFDLGPQSHIVYGMLTGTYIGGSANLAAVGNGLGVDSSMFVAVNAADIVIFFFWMAFLAQAGKLSFFTKWYPSYKDSNLSTEFDNSLVAITKKEDKKKEVNGIDVVVVLAIAIISATIGELLGSVTGIPGILFTTTIVLILANTTRISEMKIATELGLWFFMIYFVTIGSMALFSDVLAHGLNVFFGTAAVILIHGIIIFVVGKIAKIPLEFIILSSSANVGGPSTSGPHAAAYGWENLVTPAILIGVLGAAIGTYCGFGISYLIQAIL